MKRKIRTFHIGENIYIKKGTKIFVVMFCTTVILVTALVLNLYKP